MDLSNLDIPDTITVHLEFPSIGKLFDDDGNPSTIELYSPASDQAIAYKHKVQKDTIKKVGKRGIKGLNNISGEEMDRDEVKRLCAFTADVNNLIYKGELVTAKTIKLVYEDPKMGWLCDQLRERLGSWDDFLA